MNFEPKTRKSQSQKAYTKQRKGPKMSKKKEKKRNPEFHSTRNRNGII